jgi:hypothetical protein
MDNPVAPIRIGFNLAGYQRHGGVAMDNPVAPIRISEEVARSRELLSSRSRSMLMRFVIPGG